MCKAQKDLIWCVLGWSVPLFWGLGCGFIAYYPEMIAWLNRLLLPVLLSAGVVLPFALVGGGYIWKLRTVLSPEFIFVPRKMIVAWAASPAFFLAPLLFFVSYLLDTSMRGLAVTGVRLVVLGTLGVAFYFFLLVELSLVWLVAKRGA